MKRAITGVMLFACLAVGASASESFTLTIPHRFDASQEIGEVRILLGLATAPAGAQLVVGGATTVPLGATMTVAGDSVAFESAPNNRVLIRYRPLSNFSGDFCSGASAVEKNIALRFDGAQDVVDYRMSSFVVGAPMAECAEVSRRIADVPATITPNADGVAPALSATNMGRLPLDVILVLDKSGSIADVPPGAAAGTTTKAEILRAATTTFVANWQAIDAPTGGVNWDEDRIGLVFFDSTATPQTLAGADPPANFFLQRGAGWNPLITAINGLTPGLTTSIGAGINAGMEQWSADPAHDVTLIVVTDGMQNTAPLITTAPSGFLTLAPVSGLPAELRQRFIPIQTIGFGTPATVDEELLRNIALETAGRSYMGIDAATVYDTFAMTLVAVLKGNTASIATRRSATLSGAGPASRMPVVVDASARRVVFSLQWTPPFKDALDLDVFRPNDASPSLPAAGRNLPQAAIRTFDLGKGDVGKWSVRVRRSAKAKDLNAAVPYTLNVFFLEGRLDYRLSLDRGRLRAEISYGGRPLTGLPSGAVRVRMLRPRASLESVLRRTKVRQRPSSPGDPQTELQRKIAALRASAIAQLRPSEAESLTLREEKRGIYSVPLPEMRIAGSYAFEVVLDWTDPRTGHVHREERLETFK